MTIFSAIDEVFYPKDSDSADKVVAPNYDEFQNNKEIREFLNKENLLKDNKNILLVTMPHCDDLCIKNNIKEDSSEAYLKANDNLKKILESDLVSRVKNAIFIYEVRHFRNSNVRQIGIICQANTREIRTKDTPFGKIIRNEEIRESKAIGRANLIKNTQAITDLVNCAVKDSNLSITQLLEEIADKSEPNIKIFDSHKNLHSLWLIKDSEQIQAILSLYNKSDKVFVADGNHRSQASVMLGLENFMTVVFTCPRMAIFPYNRLVKTTIDLSELVEKLKEDFEVEILSTSDLYISKVINEIGFYIKNKSIKLIPKPHIFFKANSAEKIDSHIIQKYIFTKHLDMSDARDERIIYVGNNKSNSFLKEQVDTNKAEICFILAPVTIEQFINVCEDDLFMPPKSTWFEPKALSGLIIKKIILKSL